MEEANYVTAILHIRIRLGVKSRSKLTIFIFLD